MGCCNSMDDLGPINPKAVDMTHFEVHKCVGRGGFGKVHAVINRKDSKMYAMKIMEKQFLLAREGNLKTIWAERNCLTKFNSNFLVKLHYAFQDENCLYLILDFLKGGDLRYYLDRRGPMSEPFCRFYAAEILLALEEMHTHHVVYTDLKPENVLLDHDGHVCMIDFGLAVQLKEENGYLTRGERGTEGYLAPEILLKEKYGTSPDIWTLGILIYELLHNHLPWRTSKHTLNDQLMINDKLSDAAGDLLAGLLKKDAKKRLGCGKEGFAAIKKHPWFNGIDWEIAKNKKLSPPYPPDPDVANCSPIFDLEDQLLHEKKTYNFSSEQQARFKGFSFNNHLDATPYNEPANRTATIGGDDKDGFKRMSVDPTKTPTLSANPPSNISDDHDISAQPSRDRQNTALLTSTIVPNTAAEKKQQTIDTSNYKRLSGGSQSKDIPSSPSLQHLTPALTGIQEEEKKSSKIEEKTDENKKEEQKKEEHKPEEQKKESSSSSSSSTFVSSYEIKAMLEAEEAEASRHRALSWEARVVLTDMYNLPNGIQATLRQESQHEDEMRLQYLNARLALESQPDFKTRPPSLVSSNSSSSASTSSDTTATGSSSTSVSPSHVELSKTENLTGVSSNITATPNI